jgi:hypothetical protein
MRKVTKWNELMRKDLKSDKIIARIIYDAYDYNKYHIGFVCGEGNSYYEAKHIFKNKDLKLLMFQLDLKLIQEGYDIKFPGR